MHCGETFSRFGHSAGCVTLSDGTVVVGVFGGNTANFSSSVIGNPCFYQWSMSLIIVQIIVVYCRFVFTVFRPPSSICASFWHCTS